jgi:biopolymer transport protein ExbD/biopolymer transport protein TolR
MTVFAGVVLVLLVILMIVPPPVGDRGRPALAQTRHAIPMPGAYREDALIVAVLRDGKMFFDHSQIAPEQLPDKIREELNQGAPRMVYIKADRRARYRSVASAIDGVRAAGMQEFALLTEQRQSPPSIQGIP